MNGWFQWIPCVFQHDISVRSVAILHHLGQIRRVTAQGRGPNVDWTCKQHVSASELVLDRRAMTPVSVRRACVVEHGIIFSQRYLFIWWTLTAERSRRPTDARPDTNEQGLLDLLLLVVLFVFLRAVIVVYINVLNNSIGYVSYLY